MNSATGEMEDVIEPGYVGKAKGWQQVIWERGLWVDGMQNRIEEDDEDGRDQRLSAYHVTAPLFTLTCHHPRNPSPTTTPSRQVLSDCWDFAHETTALQEAFRARGHILLMCVRGHPELAGVGIENSWGKSAIHFRANNDCNPNHLYTNVLASLGRKNLPFITIFRFARRTREYGRTFAQLASSASEQTFALIEKTRKVFKCHRSSLDFDFRFIRSGGVVS